MYVTMEVLLAFCSLIMELITLVILIFRDNKKK